MKKRSCIREIETARAARSGHWTETLQQHVRGCDACRETVLVRGAVASLVESVEPPAALPDPELIRLKARLIAQRAAAEKQSERFAIFEVALQALPWVAAGGCLTWQGATVKAYFDSVVPTASLTEALVAGGSVVPWDSLGPVSLATALIGAAVFAALVALEPLSASD